MPKGRQTTTEAIVALTLLYPKGDAPYTAQASSVNVEAAAEYHARHKPQALLVLQAGKCVLEAYDGGFSADKAHALYSGTKSFWGVAAVTAQREGLLSLEERVAQTFPAWQAEAWKASVTLRQLLQLIAGVPFGGLGAAVPPYEKALQTQLKAEPGTLFTYGGIPLQIFGAVFAQKLKALNLTPHQYLHARILDPNGIGVASWRTLKDGTQPLPTGAFLTARSWAHYGEYVRNHTDEYAACFNGSRANPRYGLCWWLAPPKAPQGLFYASGSGGQAMYVAPAQQAVVVRFGNGGSYNHEAFLRRLFVE